MQIISLFECVALLSKWRDLELAIGSVVTVPDTCATFLDGAHIIDLSEKSLRMESTNGKIAFELDRATSIALLEPSEVSNALSHWDSRTFVFESCLAIFSTFEICCFLWISSPPKAN